MLELARAECDFERVAADRVQCVRCGRELPDSAGVDPATIHAICRAPCTSLGPMAGTIKVDCACGRTRAVAAVCNLHGRCLPNFRPRDGDLKAWLERDPESSLYRLCCNCEDYHRC